MSVTTPFEDSASGDPDWTSLEEEDTFFDSIEAQSSRLVREQTGTSYGGRPIYVVRIGYPSAPTTTEVLSADSVVFLNAGIHGNEQTGRQGLLHFLRDLAFTEDSDLQAYLADHPIVAIPTANPDGLNNSRTNDASEDPNRQYLNYLHGEARAVSRVIRDHRPHVVLDLHDGANSFDWEFLEPTNGGVHADIVTQSVALKDAIKATVGAEGFTSGDYPGGTGVDMLRNYGGMANCVTVLSEGTRQPPDGATRKIQANVGSAFLLTTINWHSDNLSAVQSAVVASTESVINDDPGYVGYELNSAQFSTAQTPMITTGMNFDRIEGSSDRYVSMAQSMGRVAYEMLDGMAGDNIVSATRLSSVPSLITSVLNVAGLNVTKIIKSGVEQVVTEVRRAT